jgi:putative spermidine/putrescine transport system ATP-binding protein
MAYLEVNGLRKRFGSFEALAGVSFSAEQGDIVALLGPSGCGKTTLLNLIAGFLVPDEGDIRVDSCDLAGVSPHRRGMAMMFQNYALFPHLTVAQNVAFGLDAHGVPRRESAPRVEEALTAVRLAGIGARYPSALSGGQQQRVALARSLVLRPSLLLLDEPLSNLDTLLRKAMRDEVRDILKSTGMTAVLVTHDHEEALAVADRILLMSAGKIEQAGAPEDVYERPRTLFGARFMETTNFFSGEVAGREGGMAILKTALGTIRSADGAATVGLGQSVTVAVRPERIRLGTATPADNKVIGTVRRATYLGTMTRLHVAVGDATLIAHVPISAAVRENAAVDLAWSAAETLVLTKMDTPEHSA